MMSMMKVAATDFLKVDKGWECRRGIFHEMLCEGNVF
jgi:hypothetical protein